MKKLLSAVLCALLMGLCACGRKNTDTLEAFWPILVDLYTFVCLSQQDDWDATSAAFDRTGIVNPSVLYDAYILHFKNANGEGERPFTDQEYKEIYEQYCNPSNPMKFTFIPIDD